MEIIKKRGDYRIEFNGGKTYMLIDSQDTCYECFDTERKAINALNRTAELAGQ